MSTMESSQIRLSADVGGTFTDVAAFDETTGELKLGKTLTTPARLVDGIEGGVAKAGADFRAARLFLHGTTVAINTILERTGAPCALITTQGFRDIYEIGRVNRPESYNLFFRRHEPLIDRDLRYEIRERVDSQGKVLIKLDEDQVRAAVADAVGQGVQAIAILFLHSYRNPAHEQRVKAIIEQSHPQLFVTASHELSQEYREFERTSTAAANAYVGPRVRRYLGEMGEHLEAAGFGGEFLIVQSTGGLFDADEARSACIKMLESGPAAGVIGTKALCDGIGLANAIAFDMGGTTAKAGVIHQGSVLMIGSTLVGGYATGLPVQIPMIDIQEVGTGGGSIARVEMGGALHVGPESAGAAAGPGLLWAAAAASRPSPTPISFSAGSAPTASSAARCGSTSTAPSARWSSASPSRSASISRRRPTASCGSPPPRCRTWCAGSPPSAGSMPPISRSSPMAAPGRCTPPWSRASCASPRW